MTLVSASRVDVSAWETVRVEPRGAAAKVWVREPGGSSSKFDSDWLFKPATEQANGVRQIGDWTECAGSRVARALEIPAAETKLALRWGVDGAIVRNVRAPGYDMVSGRLAMVHELGIATRDSARDKTASIGHTLDNVLDTLTTYGPPPGWGFWADGSAIDVMVGYLILDALLGNGDRHEQNWSVLRARSSTGGLPDALAPSYDLEASLGFQLSDEQRKARLNDSNGMEAFAQKGRARRFDGDRATSLVDLASQASRRCTIAGRQRVGALIEKVATIDFAGILRDVGGVSEVGRTFALKVLEINRRRLRDADWSA